jgi:hypothetical protein
VTTDRAAALATAADPEPTPMISVLRALLITEAIGSLVVTIALSQVAGAIGGSAENGLRFTAAGALLFGLFAAIASRGARRRRPSAWTIAAVLQVLLAIGTGIAVIAIEWHPLMLVGFGLAALVMLVLSTASVRRALGQD